MFSLFFDGVQSVLGKRLTTVASVLHIVALLLLVGMWVLPPVLWRVRRWRAAYGIREGTVIQCQNCGYAALPAGLTCRHCGRELDLPALLRLSVRLREWRMGKIASRMGNLYHGMGLAGLYAFTGLFAYELDVFRPGPDLRKLFIAVGTIVLVVSCVLFRRALSLHSGGPLFRLSNLFLGFSALGFVLFFVFVASATAPVEWRYLGTLRHDGAEITFNDLRVPATGVSAGIEYLQVGQPALGYHHIFLLALEGNERVPVQRDSLTRVFLAHLTGAPDRYERLGFVVRIRVERRALTIGVPYAVYSVGREITFQQYQSFRVPPGPLPRPFEPWPMLAGAAGV